MADLDHNKTFRFSLHQEDILLYEKGFDANQISPHTRNFIDIRSSLYDAIKKMQKLLSQSLYVNGSNYYDYMKNIINSYPKDIKELMKYDPKEKIKLVDDREFKGVECRFSLSINDNLIVERYFYVENFNPVVRWSRDLVETMNKLVDDIFQDIVKKDCFNIWDDYDIIKRTGMTIIQVREMPLRERKRWLYKIKYE